MGSTKNLYISAYIAFGSYLLLVLLFFLYVSVDSVKKFDAISKDTILELDIVLQDNKVKKTDPLKVKALKQDSKISKKVVKKSTSVSAKQRSNLKSLFANVKTKSTVVKKKQVNTVKKSSFSSRFKSKFEKQTKTQNISLSKLLESKETKASKPKSGESKNEKDAYISKIYEILFNRWSPLLIIDGLSAKVIITIYSTGRFDYKLIQYSGDSTFDNQLESFLEKQKGESFPPPDKSKIDIEVIFTAKGN